MGEDLKAFEAEWYSEVPYITAHTSGSTGTPKEIRLPKDDMRHSALATCRKFGITRDSHLVIPLAPQYIATKMMIVRSIVSGARLTMLPASNRPDFSSVEGRMDLLAIVPSQLPYVLNESGRAGDIGAIIVGGAPMTPSSESLAAGAPCEVCASYGMTETCSHVALRCVSAGETVYRAMPGISFETDGDGRLIIVAPHYSFGRLLTNDIVRLHDAYSFEWLGRYDNVINSGGIKIQPELVESRLAGHIPYPFYISGTPDDKWGQAVTLNIEVPDGVQPPDTEDLLSLCRQHLTPHEVPRRVVIHKAFKRTATGKLRR